MLPYPDMSPDVETKNILHHCRIFYTQPHHAALIPISIKDETKAAKIPGNLPILTLVSNWGNISRHAS